MTDMGFSEYMETLGVNRDNVERLKSEMLAAVEEQRLKDVRKSLGMTQVELAAEAGISQNRVSDIENGRTSSLRVDTLKRYANALGCDVEILFNPRSDDDATPFRLAVG